MAATPDAIDESWSRLDPAEAARRGIRVVYGYLSHDPGKNITAAQIRAYHAHGVAVWLGWESEPGRPLLGSSAGAADGRDASAQVDALIRQVGYAPRNRLAIPYSCDRDVTAAQLPTCLAYYKSAEAASGHYYAGAYGEAALVDYLFAHGMTHGLFQTYAWSGGRLSPHADLYQYLNGQTVAGASVDFDRVLDDALLGAWWPPGHPLDSPTGGTIMDAEIKARFDKIDERMTALFAVDTNADGKGDYTGTVQSAVRFEVAKVRDDVAGAVKLLAEVAPIIASTDRAVAGMASTVASIPGAVAGVAKTVAAITLPSTVQVDAQAVAAAVVAQADAIASAVVTKLKTLSWGAR